jgi:hypothetical protein
LAVACQPDQLLALLLRQRTQRLWLDGLDQCYRAPDGWTYGFVIYDTQEEPACISASPPGTLRIQAAREARGLLVAAMVCELR